MEIYFFNIHSYTNMIKAFGYILSKRVWYIYQFVFPIKHWSYERQLIMFFPMEDNTLLSSKNQIYEREAIVRTYVWYPMMYV